MRSRVSMGSGLVQRQRAAGTFGHAPAAASAPRAVHPGDLADRDGPGGTDLFANATPRTESGVHHRHHRHPRAPGGRRFGLAESRPYRLELLLNCPCLRREGLDLVVSGQRGALLARGQRPAGKGRQAQRHRWRGVARPFPRSSRSPTAAASAARRAGTAAHSSSSSHPQAPSWPRQPCVPVRRKVPLDAPPWRAGVSRAARCSPASGPRPP